MISLGISVVRALDTTDAGTMISTAVTDVGTVLASGLTSVLALVAALIGLFFVIRFVTKKIGRGK